MYELPKDRMVPKYPVCGLTQKMWSCICGFTGICHSTGVEGVKMRCCLLLSRRIFYPTNLLHHVAPSIELMMQMWPI